MCDQCRPERTGKRGWFLVMLIVAMVVWCAVRFTGGWPW